MLILLNLVNHYETAFAALALLLEFTRCFCHALRSFCEEILSVATPLRTIPQLSKANEAVEASAEGRSPVNRQ